MTDAHVQPVENQEFKAEAAITGDEIRVRMAGNADLLAKPGLDRFLTELHDAAASLGVAEVVVDVRPLEFMNSSCLKSFVSWISTLEDRRADVPYRITFVSNPAMHWQKRSLHALACFGAELVHVSLGEP